MAGTGSNSALIVLIFLATNVTKKLDHYNLRSCQWIDLQHIIECLPYVAYFLATPIEPIKETSLNSIPKAVYGSEFVSYTVIVIVPNKYPI